MVSDKIREALEAAQHYISGRSINGNKGFNATLDKIDEALALLPQSPQEGMVLVPREPTEAMMRAGLYQAPHETDWADVYSIWHDMIAASSPSQEQEKGP